MDQEPDTPLRLQECEALCATLPPIDPDGTRPQAVIVQVASHLVCFLAVAGGTYEPMTMQNGFSEEPLRFVATEETFARKCVPTVLSKVGFVDKVILAFVDTQLDWKHDEVLLQWAAHQNEAHRMTQASSVIIQTYVAERNATPEPDTQIVWHRPSAGQDAKTSRIQTVRRQDRKGKHITHATAVAMNRASNGVILSLLDDIPAEFDQIVWKLVKEASGQQETRGSVRNRMAVQGRCLSTMEMTALLHKTPTFENLVNTYRDLRSAEGQWASVPMIGFDRRWLTTQSHLSKFTLVELRLEVTDLAKFRAMRYLSAQIVNRRGDRFRAAAQQCLDMASQGLLLFDLSDDIICELVGGTRARLSIADACRVHGELSGGELSP